MSVDEYKRLHSEWMDDRVDRYGELPQPEEAAWAERLDVVWQRLTAEQQEVVEGWIQKQHEWRKENGIPPSGKEFAISPEERAQMQFEGEYDLILAEGEHDVVFQIAGRDVTISRGVILDYDEEGRFWVSRRDAEGLGLLH